LSTPELLPVRHLLITEANDLQGWQVSKRLVWNSWANMQHSSESFQIKNTLSCVDLEMDRVMMKFSCSPELLHIYL
nr:hypothetical protein [Tanacetum cinerariifolium]